MEKVGLSYVPFEWCVRSACWINMLHCMQCTVASRTVEGRKTWRGTIIQDRLSILVSFLFSISAKYGGGGRLGYIGRDTRHHCPPSSAGPLYAPSPDILSSSQWPKLLGLQHPRGCGWLFNSGCSGSTRLGIELLVVLLEQWLRWLPTSGGPANNKY